MRGCGLEENHARNENSLAVIPRMTAECGDAVGHKEACGVLQEGLVGPVDQSSFSKGAVEQIKSPDGLVAQEAIFREIIFNSEGINLEVLLGPVDPVELPLADKTGGDLEGHMGKALLPDADDMADTRGSTERRRHLSRDRSKVSREPVRAEHAGTGSDIDAQIHQDHVGTPQDVHGEGNKGLCFCGWELFRYLVVEGFTWCVPWKCAQVPEGYTYTDGSGLVVLPILIEEGTYEGVERVQILELERDERHIKSARAFSLLSLSSLVSGMMGMDVVRGPEGKKGEEDVEVMSELCVSLSAKIWRGGDIAAGGLSDLKALMLIDCGWCWARLGDFWVCGTPLLHDLNVCGCYTFERLRQLGCCFS
ncbi:hypothetical protein Dimus_010287 [Dionaea muscipula]